MNPRILILSLLLAACQSGPTPNGQGRTPVTASAAPQTSAMPPGPAQPGPAPGPATPASAVASPAPGSTPTAFPSATASDLSRIASLKLLAPLRFLAAAGASTRLSVLLLDAAGQPLNLSVPLVWTSERPGDLRVDDQGLVTALKADGFAGIRVSVPGTSLSATQLISVSTGAGGGGGGGGTPNAAPALRALSASSLDVLGFGIPIELSASASDADGDPLTYRWFCRGDCGSFPVSEGATVYWYTPFADGEYTLTVSVSDGRASDSRSLDVTVTGGSSAVTVDGEIEADD